MIVTIAFWISAAVFVAGIVYRVTGKAASVKKNVTHTDTTPFELDHRLVAYLRRNGGI